MIAECAILYQDDAGDTARRISMLDAWLESHSRRVMSVQHGFNMPDFKDLTGKRFGRLTVMRRSPTIKGRTIWHCKCDCGASKDIGSQALLSGATKSCRCLSKEVTSKRESTHRASLRGKAWPEYKSWQKAKDRTTNPKCPTWEHYGERGIIMCERWIRSFENFIADMGRRPGKGYSLGRINNDGNYCPENCRWETQSQQMNNTSKSHFVEMNGKRQTITQWCRELGFITSNDKKRIESRLSRGASPERAFSNGHLQRQKNNFYAIHRDQLKRKAP